MRGAVRWLRAVWRRPGRDDLPYRVQEEYRKVFAGAPLVLADLAHLCHAVRSSVTSADPNATVFNEGKRAVFLHILDMLELDATDLARVTDPLVEP